MSRSKFHHRLPVLGRPYQERNQARQDLDRAQREKEAVARERDEARAERDEALRNPGSLASCARPAPAAKHQPIIVRRPVGTCPDEMDTLGMTDGFEDPELWEETMTRVFEDAKSDPVLAKILVDHDLEADHAASFNHYFNSLRAHAIRKLLNRLGVGKDAAIADVGCGRGHMVHALYRLGYNNLVAMDPNVKWFTGTGYLKSLPGHNISIVNDLSEWRNTFAKFDAVVSAATIHHWQHIPAISIDTRRVMKPGAYWVAIAEFIANTSRELVWRLKGHPTASRYRSYEWPYPASAYVDLIQSAGFALAAVIPRYYNNDEFLPGLAEVPPNFSIESFSREVDIALLASGGTVEAFWEEVDAFRRKDDGFRFYTSPQAFVFQRAAI